MVSEKVKGKWVITKWQGRIIKQKCYLFTFYLKSECNFDDFDKAQLHTTLCYESNLQETINSLTENEDIICLSVYEKKDLDFESEK